MLDGLRKQQTIVPKRTKREPNISKFAQVTEVTPEAENAEPAILVTESGRLRLARALHRSKS
jgi:hypothetical protein